MEAEGGGGGGVFIEWCESLCNDRSLMKSSFRVLIHSAASLPGPRVTVQRIPPLKPRPHGTHPATGVTGGGPVPSVRFRTCAPQRG